MTEKSCKGKCETGCSDCNQIQQRIFEREVDEELQRERLATLWKKYGWLVIGGAAGVILCTIGVQVYQTWQQKVRLAESDVYENALVLAARGDAVGATTALEELAQNGRTGYRYLAQMETAGILMSGTEKERGLGILKDLADNTSAPVPLREAAMVSYVGHRLNSANQAELQAYLLPILKRPESAFFGEASELSALMSMLAGQKEVAVGTIQKALAVETIMPTVRERLTALLREMEK